MNGLLKINGTSIGIYYTTTARYEYSSCSPLCLVKNANKLLRNDMSGVSGKIRVTLGNVGSVSTSLARGKSKDSKSINFNENLSLTCANVDPALTKVSIELVSEADQVIARAEDGLDQIITSVHPPSIVLTKHYELLFVKDNTCGGKANITFTWENHSKASSTSSSKKKKVSVDYMLSL